MVSGGRVYLSEGRSSAVKMAMRMKRGLVPLAALAVVAGSMVVAPSTAWAAGGIDNEEAMGQKGWLGPKAAPAAPTADGVQVVAAYDAS